MEKATLINIFKIIAAIFGVLIIIGLIYYREDIFQSSLDPGKPYQTYAPPSAPDYSKGFYWLDLPDLSVNRDNLAVGGDVFVIVPELYTGGDEWNVDVDNAKQRADIQTVIRPNYIAPFRAAGRVFAPFYRQASMYCFMTNREDARAAQDFAYKDVKRAFDVFLRNSPPERPIIIAGYGQGGAHAERLLADYFQGPLAARLAAAYVIDYPLPIDFFQTQYGAQKPCESADDTGCIISWGAFMPRDKNIAERYITRLRVHNGKKHESVDGKPLLCTNPLLWNRTEDYAPRRLHKGGVAAIALEPGTQPAPLSKQAGVQCQSGILYVDKPRSRTLRRPIRIGGQYRTLPSNLFYEDIAENSKQRVDSLLSSGHLPRRAPKINDDDTLEITVSPITPIKD